MKTVHLHQRPFQCLLTPTQIADRVRLLGQAISQDFAGRKPLMVGVLNGAFVFVADLVRQLTIQPEIAFVRYASYEGMQSTGKLQALLPLNEQVAGRDVILIEDIVDSGHTMQQLIALAQQEGAASVRVASLLLKPDALQVPLTVDYVGFEIENRFVVGYGLDYDGQGRELAGIYVLAE